LLAEAKADPSKVWRDEEKYFIDLGDNMIEERV